MIRYCLVFISIVLSINCVADPKHEFTVDQVSLLPKLEREFSRKLAETGQDLNAKFDLMVKQAELYVLYNRIELLNALIARIQGLTEQPLSHKKMAELLYLQGYSEYFSGQSNQADSYLKEALDLLKTENRESSAKNKDAYFQAKVSLLYGLNKAYLQEYKEAISILTNIYELAGHNKWPNLQGNSLYNLGDVHYELKHYESALEYYRRASSQYSESDKVDLAFANMAIAQMTNIVGDKLEALHTLDKVIENFKQQQNIVGLADAYLLKSYFLSDSRPEEALGWIADSVKIREKLALPIDIANAYVHYSSLLGVNNRPQEALKYAEIAAQIVEELDDFSAKWDAYNNYAFLLNENEYYQMAYQYMSKSERALLAKARLDITNETARLSVQFELRQQQLENIFGEKQKTNLEERNQLLQSKVSLQQEIHSTQSLMLQVLFALLLLFLLLILVIYRLYYKTKILAARDGLTGLKNRREVMSLAEHEFAVSQRYGHPLSIIMLDIDRFKSINDHYGHAAGDKTLKAMAKILSEMLRKSDYVGRVGGEEFLIVMPHTEEIDALHFSERIRKQVKVKLAKQKHKVKEVTVSLGVASWDVDKADEIINIQQIIARADQALYCAKNQGRDQVQTLNSAPKRKAPKIESNNSDKNSMRSS